MCGCRHYTLISIAVAIPGVAVPDDFLTSEILSQVRHVVSDDEASALANDLKAADSLDSKARETAIAVALARYPEARRLVRVMADPERPGRRGEWLSSADWQRFDLHSSRQANEENL